LMQCSGCWSAGSSQTTLGVPLQQQSAAPYLDYPTGSVRVASQLPDGTTSIKTLSFGGGSPPSEGSNKAAQLQNTLQWFSNNNKHAIKLTSSVSREHNTSDVDASLGAFSFNSLADLEAGGSAPYSP